jgi:deoxyribodipyrimidine photolyase-related protein
MGLITPLEIREALDQCDFNQYGLNNFEGFVRQIFGWREFIRFLNIKYYTDFHTLNFFSNSKSLTKDWYNGSTSIPILNDMIKTLKDFGYLHHIPRLMIISNIMNLTGIKPQEVYKWFMETFIDSSDWVMTPNVFGMGLYSDGGIFATKPYICGSNYLLKMSNYAKGPWIKELDGLYWNFIDKNKNFFKSNHRLSMMYYALQKMDKSKISEHKKYANEFIKKYAK